MTKGHGEGGFSESYKSPKRDPHRNQQIQNKALSHRQLESTVIPLPENSHDLS